MKLRTRGAGGTAGEADDAVVMRSSARPRKAPGPRGGVQKRRVSSRRSVVPTPKVEDRQLRQPPASAPAPGRGRRTRAASATPRRQPRRAASQRVEVEQLGFAKTKGELTPGKEEKEEVEVDRPKTIEDIPEEVMLGIFSYFRPPQLCWKIGRVCRQWASWTVSPLLWKNKEYILSPDPNLGSKHSK